MKKYHYYIILAFSFFTIFICSVNSKDELYLIGKSIVIDPGHGYLDPGTIYNEIYEKDINLKISLYLKDELEKKGASVQLTRSGDYDLSSPNAVYRKKSDFDNRISFINNSDANIYVSIHLNYLNDTKYYGPQVFYNGKNIYLANIIQKELNNNLNISRKVKLIPKETYMYSKLKIPGVLIECGFLSNEEERNKLISTSYQQKFAKIVANGIVKYFS